MMQPTTMVSTMTEFMPIRIRELDRDVNSGVELIKQIERLKGMMNMIYIVVDGGIGCGVMINSHTYRGNRGIAGEMGRITMMSNHQHCACGNVGCLELSASDFAILRRCREILHLDERVPLSVDDAVQLYRDGNEEMIAAFRLAVSNLAIAIRNVFMLYDPEVAYLRCRWLHTEDPLYFRLLEEVYIGNTLLEQNSIRIVLLNEDHFVLRSAGAGLHFFDASSANQTPFADKAACIIFFHFSLPMMPETQHQFYFLIASMCIFHSRKRPSPTRYQQGRVRAG